ncbi:MAG: NAD(P)-binding protein [Bacteroidales bacterium]|nr:NAD(P)-binding protein [Bacteroidales bacterium]
MNPTDIIIGAGITGLAFARFERNHPFRILERSATMGGYARTTLRNGFVWDYSGHFFHFQDNDIERMVSQHMRREDILTVKKVTHIKYKDRLVDFPFQKNIHQLPQEEFIDCLYDLFTAPKEEYHSFQEMLYCKFGRAISEKFLIPYNSKLYACDLNRLDKDAMGRFFPYASPEEIVRNFRQSDNASYNVTFEYPKGGAIEYVKSLVHGLPAENILTRSGVAYINPHSHMVTLTDGTTMPYDRLISTIPFPFLMRMTGLPHNPDVFTWNKVLVFNLGFEKKGLNVADHWIYFPERQYPFYRVGFYDNILQGERMSLYVELGFEKDEVVNAQALLPQVLESLKTAGILQEGNDLVDHEVILMNPAYVHINQQSIAEVKRLKETLASLDIYSIGRYGSWTYCSIEDNIKEARALAAELNG